MGGASLRQLAVRFGTSMGTVQRCIARRSEGKDARYLSKPRRLLAKPQERDRKLLLYMAQKMAWTRSRRTEASN